MRHQDVGFQADAQDPGPQSENTLLELLIKSSWVIPSTSLILRADPCLIGLESTECTNLLGLCSLLSQRNTIFLAVICFYLCPGFEPVPVVLFRSCGSQLATLPMGLSRFSSTTPGSSILISNEGNCNYRKSVLCSALCKKMLHS